MTNIEAIELHRLEVPLVRPFETSFGRETVREVLLVRVRTDAGDGWGECVAGREPFYSGEYVDGAAAVIERWLAPALLERSTTAAWSRHAADEVRAADPASAAAAAGWAGRAGATGAGRGEPATNAGGATSAGRAAAAAGAAGAARSAGAAESPRHAGSAGSSGAAGEAGAGAEASASLRGGGREASASLRGAGREASVSAVDAIASVPLAASVAPSLAFVAGHRMAKAALEAAVLDAELRTQGRSMAAAFGAVRDWVDCGVSVGIAPSVDELLDEVRGYLDAGYQRIKLKIKPGWDLVPVGAVRELLGPRGLLQVDANTAYTRDDIPLLASLDPFGLLLIEQPFEETDLGAHAALAAVSETPVCLDESILDATTAVDAIERGATSIVNIKAGRMGGYLEALRVHDACRALDIPVWCGGMLETGVGRAANVALAALPGFTLPGDTSASSRYFADDLTEPFELADGEHRGQLRVPDGPGTGVTVREELVRDWASTHVVTIGR